MTDIWDEKPETKVGGGSGWHYRRIYKVDEMDDWLERLRSHYDKKQRKKLPLLNCLGQANCDMREFVHCRYSTICMKLAEALIKAGKWDHFDDFCEHCLQQDKKRLLEKAEKYDLLNALRFEYHYEPQNDPIFTLGRLLNILEQQKNKLEAIKSIWRYKIEPVLLQNETYDGIRKELNEVLGLGE